MRASAKELVERFYDDVWNRADESAARDILEAILKATPIILPAQIEAARLYQDWGATAKGQERHYIDAIVGARPDKAKNDKNTKPPVERSNGLELHSSGSRESASPKSGCLAMSTA